MPTPATWRHIDLRMEGDITVVTFRQKILMDEGEIAELGQELLFVAWDATHLKLILSFAGVDFASAAILQHLIVIEKKLRASGGSLKLCCMNPDVLNLFTTTNLDKLFKIYANEADALSAMQ